MAMININTTSIDEVAFAIETLKAERKALNDWMKESFDSDTEDFYRLEVDGDERLRHNSRAAALTFAALYFGNRQVTMLRIKRTFPGYYTGEVIDTREWHQHDNYCGMTALR